MSLLMIRGAPKNAVLMQLTKVEAIQWTGSGDGIITAGIEVVLWKKKDTSWEIAWKFKENQPQNLVSATWSIEGPSATAAYMYKPDLGGSNEVGRCVLICYSDGKSEYAKVRLPHPQPIVTIQWRPSTIRRGDAKYSSRHVLLTCCLDGTLRLWSEMDSGRVKKVGRDINDHKIMRRSFCVVAVIEVNQALNGDLGMDVFFTWATENQRMFKSCDGDNQFITAGEFEHGGPGKCEWLIGFGPGMLVTFWAIHCLDDINPLRFPRVTLWKKRSLESGTFVRGDFSSFKEQLILHKVAISRNCLSGSPTVCSLICLSPYNSLVWSFLDTRTLKSLEDISPNESQTGKFLPISASGILDIDGHTGKILQVAVHPCASEVELAVSLDSDGLLLFWSLSTISNSISALPTLTPSWKQCGKLKTQGLCSKYTSLSWAPSMLHEDRVLLMGHVAGIDCFIVKVSRTEEDEISCNYICTIPLSGHRIYEEGPTNIFSIPLPYCNYKMVKYNKFLVLGVWMNGFEALSWEITFHPVDLLGSCCECNVDDNAVKCIVWKFEITTSDKRYCIVVYPRSSQFPEAHTNNQITSFAVVCPSSLISVDQKLANDDDICHKIPAYTMATGSSEGILKLWRNKLGVPSTLDMQWELVGMFVAHQGPVSTLCLTNCGRKIATVSSKSDLNAVSTLSVWESVYLSGFGSFILEDTLSFDRSVVAVNWLTFENGQFLLGVCMENELRIYAQRRCDGQTLLNSKKSLKMRIWMCIAIAYTSPAIHGLFSGRRASAIVVHNSYFSLFSRWLFLIDKENQDKCHPNFVMDNSYGVDYGTGTNTLCAVSTGCDIGASKVSSIEDLRREFKSPLSVMTDMKSDVPRYLFVASDPLQFDSGINLGFWSILEIAEKLRGSLPAYHPEALLTNIYSGNWKRAYTSVRHLAEYLTSHDVSEKRCASTKSGDIVPQILLSNYYEGFLSKGSVINEFKWSGVDTSMTSFSQFNGGITEFAYNFESADASTYMINSSSSKSELCGFAESLENLNDLLAVTTIDKMDMLAVVDVLKEVSNMQSASAYENLDEPGRRFWVALRFQQLHFSRRFGRLASMEELMVESRLIGWAFHSDCQETLFGSVLSNEPSWPEMRALGVGFWFTNMTQLRIRMEKLARSQYLKSKKPKDCALLYVALNRIQVLAGLYKLSKDEKDKPLVAFLSRNFQEEKNKAAALKNAYVLLGRHQLELAVAFFLLGGDAVSAINVCAKNLGDEQLALVICRLLETRGGPLERHLITKFILPSAMERKDYWLASLLEWELGNYPQSFLTLIGFQETTVTDKFALLSNGAAFVDPGIGLYCLTLANKNCMKNAIGEKNAAILGRWATLMRATALNRCGLPLEALECLSSSPSTIAVADQGSEHSQIIPAILTLSACDSSNWLSGDVALHLESHGKLDLSLQYFSKLMWEHPSWPNLGYDRASTCSVDLEAHQHRKILEAFQCKLYTGLAYLEQRFALESSSLVSLIVVFLYSNGLSFIGYDILCGYTCRGLSQDESNVKESFLLYFLQHKPLLRATEDFSFFISRFIAASSITCSNLKPLHIENGLCREVGSACLNAWGNYFRSIILSLWSLRAAMRNYFGYLTEELIMEPLLLLDLYEYYVHFASACLQRNSKNILLLVQPLLITYTDGHTPYDVDMVNLKKIFHQTSDLVVFTSTDDVEGMPQVPNKKCDLLHSIPEDERWQIMGACLWQHMSRFTKHKLNSMSMKLDDNHSTGFSCGKFSPSTSSLKNSESSSMCVMEHIRLLSLILSKSLNSTLLHVSSYHVKQLAIFLQQKLEIGFDVLTCQWLEESKLSQPTVLHSHLREDAARMYMMNDMDKVAVSELLWDACADANIIFEGFMQEKIDWRHLIHCKPSKGWTHINEVVMMDHENKAYHNHGGSSSSPPSGEIGTPSRGHFRNGHTLLSSWHKDTSIANEVTPFQSPQEICRRNGELFETMCINSVDQRQVAVASSRKGIVFFNWENGLPFRGQVDYIWSDADWPHNGWPGSESAPMPTLFSSGIGLGSKKAAHLGLGGATIGLDSSERPVRDLTGGGAFGNPGYAGIRASGLGWEIQDDFEECSDPPATLENISTRAFSSHPSRPFFLVGSSNTHIYLWEFGKDKATATYGVLPAANVPPPYALASISALQFDHFGHRFASAALDGTVCTWQLEVGRRSNVCPTESSLCFNSHATDVTYITSSGSVIAAAGHSSSGINVVIWDTLAPPSSSRASIICHEGGARSISVFDNNIGSGSVSPLIVTGGKGGDVGIHDFRYIVTGRAKRHRHLDSGDPNINSSVNTDMRTGSGNDPGDKNGMLWYIPKAHSGSVTSISTIPNTSLFLTGSKDGDVKLWDAKAAKLVYHWPKLHERHTFLQPSSRGFGGVVRAAVTDIQVVSHGFLTCGGDGSVKLVQLKDVTNFR